jgi:uncharacterized membrane-anchored protein
VTKGPSWKIRRRYIFASFALGVVMLISAIAAVWSDRAGAGELVTGGVGLITLILTSYIFGAVWEDKSKYPTIEEENPDG